MQDYLYNLATDKIKGFIPAAIKLFLFILSIIYGLVVRILIFFELIFPRRLNCKVISVGNITLGGTGKTSLVEYIARYLKQNDHFVAILSRGYKRKTIGHYGLSLPAGKAGTIDYEAMGDEPYMLAKNLGDMPVLVDKDRMRAAQQAIHDYQVDTAVLDDGFQQWRIKKDLEIVTIDATNPFGNRHLMPRGILRQPLSSLGRADVFVLTKTNLVPNIKDTRDFLAHINPKALIFESIHQPLGLYKIDNPNELLSLETFEGKSATLFSGIGDPDSFEKIIKNLGIKIGLSLKFRDHYNYNQADLDKIIKSSQDKNIDLIITTQKDAVRVSNSQLTTYLPVRQAGNSQLLVLRIGIKIIEDEDRFHNRLLKLYSD
jgi:tetraacyldisaccharide 4'-kinase